MNGETSKISSLLSILSNLSESSDEQSYIEHTVFAKRILNQLLKIKNGSIGSYSFIDDRKILRCILTSLGYQWGSIYCSDTLKYYRMKFYLIKPTPTKLIEVLYELGIEDEHNISLSLLCSLPIPFRPSPRQTSINHFKSLVIKFYKEERREEDE